VNNLVGWAHAFELFEVEGQHLLASLAFFELPDGQVSRSAAGAAVDQRAFPDTGRELQSDALRIDPTGANQHHLGIDALVER
jgi:hypothetical protein